ncbi:hypothetical protein GN958_ATG01238 [Phytophthora infestans]|uniref:Uncharacterized protein n=1 Tax=Phytophthora infestans TaxID=4787 RepID=A0A8S9VFY3_PHYIN|nr:hypothetical protein GN958_ATG01238 [Phytophthora infestans]
MLRQKYYSSLTRPKYRSGGAPSSFILKELAHITESPDRETLGDGARGGIPGCSLHLAFG